MATSTNDVLTRIENLGSRTWAIVFASGLVGIMAVLLAWDMLGLPGAHNMGNDDFVAFYSAAKLVVIGHTDLIFNQAALKQFQIGIMGRPVGLAGYMPYLNPPFYAVALTPLTLLPEPVARVAWLALNIGLVLIAARLVTHDVGGKQKAIAFLLVVASVPAYWALSEGQPSILILVCLLLALTQARKGRRGATGLWLAVLWLKPHLALMTLAALLLFGRRREAIAMTATLAAASLVSLLVVPAALYVDYAAYLASVVVTHAESTGVATAAAWSGHIDKMQGLNGMTNSFAPGAPALVTTGLALAAGAALTALWLAATRIQRPGLGSGQREVMLVASLALALLLDPHLYPQDTVLAFVALPLLTNRARPFLAYLGLIALGDAVVIDQHLLVHVFGWVLLAFVAAVCWRPALAAIRIGRLTPATARTMPNEALCGPGAA